MSSETSSRLAVSISQQSDKGDSDARLDFYAALIPQDESLQTKGICCVIADAMGKDEMSAIASEQATHSFLNDYYATPPTWSVRHSAVEVLNALNLWLASQSKNEAASSMVTTFSTVIFKSSRAHIFHIGNSRIYRYRDGKFECLTEDHRILISPRNSFISRAMGMGNKLDVDYRDVTLLPEDVFLMTTDGVHDFVSTSQFVKVLQDEDITLDEKAENIINLSRTAGSEDNVTLQLIRVDAIAGEHGSEVFSRSEQLPVPPTLYPGMVVDGFEVIEQIKLDGITQFFRVIDQQSAETRVIKTLAADYRTDEQAIQAFQREQWVSRKLDSPFIIQIIEPTRTPTFLYSVIEDFQGNVLSEWMDQSGQLSLEKVIVLVEKIATALRVFHRKDIVLTNLKPENIIITDQHEILIIDFSAVQIGSINEVIKQPHRIIWPGDQFYCAAEIFLGMEIDKRADIFSLAIICYEMLSGHLPYGASLKREITWRNLNKIDYRSAIDFNPGIPLWIDGAIEKALMLDRQFRYESLSEFVYDLKFQNPAFSKRTIPLIEKRSGGLWKVMTLVLLLSNLSLLVFLFLFDVL